jgi:hypothetical protein
MADLSQDLKSALESLDAISKSLEDLNKTPGTDIPTKTPVQPEAQKYLSSADMFAVKAELKKKSNAELHHMFAIQASKADTGVPFGLWAATGGNPIQAAVQGNEILTKALDSGSGSALIRQDLEPIMYELFIREFPAFDQFTKEPANGLVHAFNQATSFGDAQFMSELGTVTDDQSTYVRQTTNVAILATRRGVSLKNQFATLQSGSGFNPENLELQGGMRSIAHKMEKTIFQGNATYAPGTDATEEGAYDPNGFDGLRKILNTARAVDVDPTASPDPENIRAAIDNALLEAMNSGGRVNRIYLRPQEQIAFDLQQDANVRYMNDIARTAVGVNVQTVNTIFGPLGLNVVPGDSIGEYERDSNTVADIYLLDMNTITVPYLGSPGPTVLDIPIGISGQLTHLFIIFGMWGLATKAPIFSNKVRVTQP